MQVLYWFQGLRSPFGNAVMQAITEFGGEYAFLALAIFLLWCVDKRKGYYLLSVGFFGTCINLVLKLLFRIPRPWVLDPNFKPVQSAVADAGGYSFPSGHSQNAVGIYGSLAKRESIKWLKMAYLALCILVPVSRMYLGVHTPKDVLTSAAIAVVLVFALEPLVYHDNPKVFSWMLLAMVGISAMMVAFLELTPWPADIDPANLANGMKTGYTMLGACLGIGIAYFADRKYLHYSTKAVWWAQVLKLLLGIALTLGLKAALKAPLYALIGCQWLADGLRYFLMVLFAAMVWPMTFRYFALLGREDRV